MLTQLYEPFQKWSQKGSVYVYSDPHFDDPDCAIMAPDWPSAEEQIKKINSRVTKSDALIILGDIGDPAYIPKIKAGYKVLIAGNHDAGLSHYTMFDEVYGGPLFIGKKILLSHEPLDIDCALNIHGHKHDWPGFGLYDMAHFNVCSNTVGFMPQNLGEIIRAGYLKRVKDIHRQTIDTAEENKQKQ